MEIFYLLSSPMSDNFGTEMSFDENIMRGDLRFPSMWYVRPAYEQSDQSLC